MADDNRNHGHRPAGYERPRRAPAQPAGDPLAELARLIGRQNESSSSSYRQNGSWPLPAPEQWPAADAHDAHYAPAPAARDVHEAYDGYAQGQVPSDHRYADQGYAEPGYDPAYADPRYAQPQHYDPHHPHYADPRYGDAHGYADHASAAPGYGDPRSYAEGYDRHGYAPAPADYGAGAGVDAPPYARAQGYDHPYYAPAPQPHAADEHAPARKRGGIVTVLAVLALAVVGTAAAFGYRAMFGSSGTAMPPPVIKADTRPTKVVPPTDASTKPIQDRIGVKTERVVSREEQPVDLRDPARSGAPRVVFPNLAGQNGGPTQTIANIAPSGPAPSTAPEPKKVRTVAIRPDQPAETASARPAAPPRAASEADESPRAAPARPQPSQSSAPLPLAPGAQSPAQPQRQASRGSNTGSPFPTPITSSAPAVAGAYAVQVTSQRTEADAQAAYRSLQSQFPSVLANRPAVIRRADLGEKGTFYRAQVGPFASQGEASEFCGSLKAAGGQCVVQKN